MEYFRKTKTQQYTGTWNSFGRGGWVQSAQFLLMSAGPDQSEPLNSIAASSRNCFKNETLQTRFQISWATALCTTEIVTTSRDLWNILQYLRQHCPISQLVTKASNSKVKLIILILIYKVHVHSKGALWIVLNIIPQLIHQIEISQPLLGYNSSNCTSGLSEIQFSEAAKYGLQSQRNTYNNIIPPPTYM